MKISSFAAISLILLSVLLQPDQARSAELPGFQPPEFNTGYIPSIGEKVYSQKTDGNTTRKIEGAISGIKKNRDNTVYMLIEFKEHPQPGAPVFLDGKVIGMVYRQSSASLFEAMPVRVVLDFMKNLNLQVSGLAAGYAERREVQDERILKAKEYIEANDYDRAVKILQDALKKDPDNADLHGWLAIALMEKENPVEAAKEFKKAISLEPGNADFHNGYGYAMLATGRLSDAIASFKEAVRINPKHADAHFGLGTAYINTGETKLAIREYGILKEINARAADSLFKSILRNADIELE